MAGAFGSYFFAAAFAESGFLDRHIVVSVIVLLLSSMAVSVGVAVLLERVAYRPVRRAPRVVPLITAIGASLFLQGTFSGFFGPDFKGYPKPEILGGQWELFGVTVKRTDIVVFLTMVVAVAALQYFVRRTTTGKSMRAVAYDREIASLMGIDVDRVVLTTFAIGGLLAGIAAVLYSMTFGQIGPFMGFLPGIAAFTAAVLGGIGSIGGAALGGLLLGILQSVGPYLLLSGFHVPSPFQLKDVVTFSVLVLVLLFRPAGLLGSEEVDRL
jgi:branched-chain amino acid transport system permease protein